MVADQPHCNSEAEGDDATPRRSLLAYPRRNKTLTSASLIHHGLYAGPTVVVDQQHCSATQRDQEDATPRRSLLAYPRKNNFLMFDGRLGHGVLDTLSGGTRMTLLINWWQHKPMVRTVWSTGMSGCAEPGGNTIYLAPAQEQSPDV